MRKTFKIINDSKVDACNEIMGYFGYVATKSIHLPFRIGTLIKYKNDSNDESNLDIEVKYSPRFEFPMFLIGLICAIIVGLATAFLIKFIIKGEGYDKLFDFFCFMVPSFLLILIDTGFAIWRYFASIKNSEIFNSVNYIKEQIDNDKK